MSNTDGLTPLLAASLRGVLEMVKVLVAKGADPTAHDQEGRSAAGYAAITGKQDVIEYLQTLASR